MHDGLYDRLLGEPEVEELSTAFIKKSEYLKGAGLAEYLAKGILESLKTRLSTYESDDELLEFANEILGKIPGAQRITAEKLLGLVKHQFSDSSLIENAPEIPLSQDYLLTNAPSEPALARELNAELFSSSRVDIIMAFVKVSGLRLLYDTFLELKNRHIPVRLITSAYLGATDKKAIDQLVSDLGVSVKIDYLANQNRLHAKAWLFHRDTGFTTAYIGSSNLSNPALTNGMEWNVRLSGQATPNLIRKFEETFDIYWNGGDFAGYDSIHDGVKLTEALARQSGQKSAGEQFALSGLEVIPQLHQLQMLEDLDLRRARGFHRNLIVAATGSGKTVVSALDYKRIVESSGKGKTLLYVVHRHEILKQARRTFAEVMKDTSFGEILGFGSTPTKWRHVFATVQSLNDDRLEGLESSRFDYIVIDEAHHSHADSYRKILAKFQPEELLGLSATPERADGINVQDEIFDGVASELRLWDALDASLLAPFHYFGIGDETNFSNLSWARGKYDTRELSNLLTGKSSRDRLMLKELARKVPNLQTMKAIFFCADVNHAAYITSLLNEKGIIAESVVGDTPTDVRQERFARLETGDIQAIVSVDVLNEGFDLPCIDTLVMLRPTESPVIFLQQLGRGLRKFDGKDACLVLDFVGTHRAEYRVDKKYSALTGISRGRLTYDIENDFPFLPSGMNVHLDELAKSNVLANIRNQVSPGRANLVQEIRQVGLTVFAEFIESTGREAWEIYRHKDCTWASLTSEAGLTEIQESDLPFGSRMRNFLHVNDDERIDAYIDNLQGPWRHWGQLSEKDKRFRNMLFWSLWRDGKRDKDTAWASIDEAMLELRGVQYLTDEACNLLRFLKAKQVTVTSRLNSLDPDITLVAHANYSQDEILASVGYAQHRESPLAKPRRETRSSASVMQGVAWVPEAQIDLLFLTLNKEEGFSPTTRYKDYAESQSVIHWESQSGTTVKSTTGQRYTDQKPGKTDVLLAIRETKSSNSITATYKLAGLADYMKHAGEKPISIWWKLRVPLEVSLYKAAAAAKVA